MRSNRILIALIPVLCLCLLCGCGRRSSGRTNRGGRQPESVGRSERPSASCRHDVVTDASIPATCTEYGLTEGSHCAKCGEILSAQHPVAPYGHSYGPWMEPLRDSSGQQTQSRFCTFCGHEEIQILESAPVISPLGSAEKIYDRTVVVSIFANDATTRWDFQTSRDNDAASLMRTHLGAGIDWLTRQVRAYGVSADFIYEWETYSDLCYVHDFGAETLVRMDGGGYNVQRDYINTYIPFEALKEKYNAQNIIYIFYFNTDETNTVNSWTLSDRSGVDQEIINIFVRDDYSGGFYYTSAGSFAHEIMHCFGAYDLYYASDAIPQAYVDHCANTGSQDIMYTVNLGTEISQEFTQLDAYYLGLTDYCELVGRWGLAESTHFTS